MFGQVPGGRRKDLALVLLLSLAGAGSAGAVQSRGFFVADRCFQVVGDSAQVPAEVELWVESAYELKAASIGFFGQVIDVGLVSVEGHLVRADESVESFVGHVTFRPAGSWSGQVLESDGALRRFSIGVGDRLRVVYRFESFGPLIAQRSGLCLGTIVEGRRVADASEPIRRPAGEVLAAPPPPPGWRWTLYRDSFIFGSPSAQLRWTWSCDGAGNLVQRGTGRFPARVPGVGRDLGLSRGSDRAARRC